MFRFRYTTWDGTQTVRLDADKVFERLAEHLSHTDDLDEALDRLLREGYDGDGFEVVGTDELLARIRDALQEIYDTYDLDHALDRHRELLDDVLAQEGEAADEAGDAGEGGRRRAELERLGRSLEEALRKLEGHRFASQSAASDFARLQADADDVRRLSAFLRRYGSLFRGRDSLGFDDALELLDRIEALQQLEQQLMNRDFEQIDLDMVGDLLGAEVVGAVENLREMLTTLMEAGYVRPRGGKLVLSAKGAHKLGWIALREIHTGLAYDSTGRHGTRRAGPMEVDSERSKPYAFGDPMNLNVGASLANALKRRVALPLELSSRDFEVYESTYNTRTATVLLLDMSWSMSWEGRFAAAKKVALAMDCLMRARFPRDYFAVVGFYTRAVELDFEELPEATWNMGDPFTNLQDGLRLGASLLERQPGRNKSMIVITDGQPTAYYAGGRLFCEWPMSLGGLSTRATIETLKEVERVTRKGVVINTFMLDDSPPLRAFVEKMTAINKGRAFYTTPSDLGRFVLVDHVGRRRKVI